MPQLSLRLLLTAWLALSVQICMAQQPWSRSSGTLSMVETWLANHPNGPGWIKYLELDKLRSEINRGEAANLEFLQHTLEHLSMGTPGTDHSNFVSLRQAIQSELTQNRKFLPFALRAARSQFKPVTGEQVESAKNKLMQAVIRLQNKLIPGSPNGEAWKNYLEWDKMLKEVEKGDKADIDVLYENVLLYTNGHPGLELPAIADVGHALRDYTDLLAVKADTNSVNIHAQRMTALADAAEALVKQPNEADPHELGLILGELQASRQVPELVTATRRLYSYPNFNIRMQQPLLAAAMNNAVNEVDSLQDNILGTRISGTTHTVATTNVVLLPSLNHASLDIQISGNVHSNTVGFNGPAVIYSRGNTAILGHQYLTLDEQGLHAQGVKAWANTDTQFTGFGSTTKHLKGMVSKIASKRAAQSERSAEYVASRKAEERLSQRISSQTPEMIAQANHDLQTKVKAPLQRWGVYPRQLHFSSDSEGINILGLTADSYQIGAMTNPPELGARVGDVQLQIHESMINNAATSILAGRLLTKAYVEEQIKKSGNKLPDELKSDDEKDWSIKLDSGKPLTVSFADNGMTIIIRGEEFTSGNEEYEAMNIKAKYTFVKANDGRVIAQRQGEVEIYPPDFKAGDQLSVKQTALKRLLTKRFDKLFKPELSGEGIQLQGRLASYGKLFLRAAASANGWLQAGLGR
jgi:hypothetical protein